MKIIKLAEYTDTTHPYEPVLCRHVKADIIAFYYDDYSNDTEMWESVARMLCLRSYRCVFKETWIGSGCLVAYRYYDKSLYCAHDIYKPFFEYFDDMKAFEYIFIERN